MRTTTLILGCFSLGFFSMACGGVSDITGAPPADDAGDIGSDIGDGGTAISKDAGGRSDGGLATGKDGGAATPVIDPLAVGETWTYDVTITGSFPGCNAGQFDSSVSQNETLGGRDAYLVGSFCPSLGSYWYSADGDTVAVYSGSDWVVGLDSPVQEGHSWSSDEGRTFQWYSAGSLTLPAGTFSDCWEARETGSATEEYSITLCRGVGPVHWHD
ncbi:MAG: hypothetical protein ACREJX_16910, partial [Polyangiaceae bacterium]